MSSFTHVFQPFKIGNLTLRNRIQMAPVGPLLARSGLATPELVEWGRTLARGGVSVVTLGDSSVLPPALARPGRALNLGSDDAIGPLSAFAAAVRAEGARASIQLNCHSPFTPTDMPREEIRRIVEYFAAAAGRCRRAGMDMVMVHGAHGQLLSRFVSPRLNRRMDAYGGSLENRAKFAVEVLEAVRERTGGRLAIEYRISAVEFTPGGLELEEQLEFARMIQGKIDLLHVSAGNLFAPETLPRMIQPAYLPRGLNVDFAARFRQELNVPVAAVGSLDLVMAENIIAEGKADTVALARALIADPDCVSKAARGLESEIRPCVRCNTCIDRTHSRRLPVRCAVNPLAGREAESAGLTAAPARKRVVVVGGGPAGMEAARTAAARGHEVVLLEKDDSLGGTLAQAAAPPFKADMQAYLDWAVRSTANTPGLTLRLSTGATPEMIKNERPNVLIIAAGATHCIPDIPGIDSGTLVPAGEVAAGWASVGERVLVAGAGLTGSETALLLARQGKKVTLIDMLPLEEIDAAHPFITIIALRALLRELNVGTIGGVKLAGVTGTCAAITDKNGQAIEIPCDTVVLALGMAPRLDVIEKLRGLAPEVRLIGDCNNRHGNLYTAVNEGWEAGAGI